MAHSRLFAGHADDQRYLRRFIEQTHLRPEIMFAEVETVVAGKNHDGIVFLTRRLQRRHQCMREGATAGQGPRAATALQEMQAAEVEPVTISSSTAISACKTGVEQVLLFEI